MSAIETLRAARAPEAAVTVIEAPGSRGIAAEAAAATAELLSSYGVRARLLTNVLDASAAVRQFLVAVGPDGVVGADIETAPLAAFTKSRPSLTITDKNALDPYRAEVRVLSLWNPRAEAALVIDLRRAAILKLPEELWDVRFVFHNATFDVKHLLHAGVPLQPDRLLCSMLATGLVARGEPHNRREGNRRPSLAVAAKELLGIDVPKHGQTADWDRQDLDQAMVNYAALDAILAYQLHKVAVSKMELGEYRALDIACGCIFAVSRLELAGLPFDVETHRATAREWETQLQFAHRQARDLTGIENLNSSSQIVEWLKRVMPKDVLSIWPRTPGDSLSTEGKVLHRYADRHPGLQAVADCSRLKALAGSFGMSLIEKINPVTSRLHTSLQIAQAKSGRFSSRNPNLQNMPRDAFVRKSVRAPKGCVLVVADYNQIELRVMAEVAGDKRMRNAYTRGLDLHAVTAAGMLRIDVDEFDKAKPEHAAARQKAKGVNFGVVYGCGPAGLVAFARDSYNLEISEQEAGAIIAAWLGTYPGIAQWQERHAALCRSTGAVTTPAGRIYRFAWEPFGRFSRNLALNLPIQGGAAEVAQIAIAKIDASLTEHTDKRARLVGQIHDEFLVVSDELEATRAKELLVKAMTEAFMELFPEAPVSGCLVDAKIVANWSQAKG